MFLGSSICNGTSANDVQPHRVDNPRWRPHNFSKQIYMKFQRLQPINLRFGCPTNHWNSCEYTLRPSRKCKTTGWRHLNFKCMYLRLQARYQRNSAAAKFWGSSILFGLVEILCDLTRSGKIKDSEISLISCVEAEMHAF